MPEPQQFNIQHARGYPVSCFAKYFNKLFDEHTPDENNLSEQATRATSGQGSSRQDSSVAFYSN
jgi:hypothetical protein